MRVDDGVDGIVFRVPLLCCSPRLSVRRHRPTRRRASASASGGFVTAVLLSSRVDPVPRPSFSLFFLTYRASKRRVTAI